MYAQHLLRKSVLARPLKFPSERESHEIKGKTAWKPIGSMYSISTPNFLYILWNIWVNIPYMDPSYPIYFRNCGVFFTLIHWPKWFRTQNLRDFLIFHGYSEMSWFQIEEIAVNACKCMNIKWKSGLFNHFEVSMVGVQPCRNCVPCHHG